MTASRQIKYINPDTMPPPFGYTNVVEVRNGRMIYISGQVALNRDGQIVGIGDLAAQTKQVFENIKAALEAAEASFDDVVKFTFFLTDISQIQVVRDIRDTYINTANPPASSAVEVRRLVNEHFLIEIEAIAAGKL
ncbi:RidA family protein [Brevibacillus sp. SYP-B805]|uniref:RidA family protein n=1 Tax=Brevibacillus sp. SYP-B805 TaxID=1578199 RepID=UPI0013ED30A9|nr:RidA family protein [Brevibacillus sp. SYP-B805]NGQ94281.1 RidA family protein [Brevibacillus sp. SYP-B805]